MIQQHLTKWRSCRRNWLQWCIIGILLLILARTERVETATAQHISPAAVELTLGQSYGGRPINAVRIGEGPRKVVLVGDTHGGPEANTYRLLLDVIDHFRQHPEEVPASVRLYLIPTLNPDGLAQNTRFNARGVDLNRNMNTGLDVCSENDWRGTVNGANGVVSETGGEAPETEIESRLIRDFLLDASAAIFYHSAGGELFPPYCEHADSIAFAKAYAEAAQYAYTRYYPRYLITGGMHDWAGSLGIASFTPELWNGNDSDTTANLAAIHQVLEQAEALFPLPADHFEQGVRIPAVLWRYWKSHGGAATFGWPLAPAERSDGRIIQYFERAVLELDPGAVDTPRLVRLRPVAGVAREGDTIGASDEHIARLFAEFWERGGGQLVYGAPISPILLGKNLVDGAPRFVQYFENVRLEYNAAVAEATVELSPLGWHLTLRHMLASPTSSQQIR